LGGSFLPEIFWHRNPVIPENPSYSAHKTPILSPQIAFQIFFSTSSNP
jgi:hypothetical protein